MARTKAEKALAVLTEVVGGQMRMTLTTPLSAIERGAIFEVIGEAGVYRTGIYRDKDSGEIVRECSCQNGEIHVRRPTCSHFLAVELVMNALGCPRSR
jgi:hypothetical protein